MQTRLKLAWLAIIAVTLATGCATTPEPKMARPEL